MIMNWKYRKIALEQLDRKYADIISLHEFTRPPKGWIRSIRQAFGMTLKQLAYRADGMQPEAISRLEKLEVSGSTTIKTLENVARALNCKFEYAFVPETSFRNTLVNQAKKVAREKINYVSHSMHLEGQKLSNEEIEDQIEEFAYELLQNKPRLIWEKSNYK